MHTLDTVLLESVLINSELYFYHYNIDIMRTLDTVPFESVLKSELYSSYHYNIDIAFNADTWYCPFGVRIKDTDNSVSGPRRFQDTNKIPLKWLRYPA